ncbi:MAG TPA: hypothetical protein VF622_09750 [Segetibacter sp.]|jgi:hypothetical protein
MAFRLAEKGHDGVITFQSQKGAAEEVVATKESSGKGAVALQFDAEKFSSAEER